MNLIEELKNYCDIDNPVGALMLSIKFLDVLFVKVVIKGKSLISIQMKYLNH